jgi:hypothetical protein
LAPGFTMAKKDPRVDAYIKNAAPFARPILVELRKVVHTACPDVTETMKWSTPTFDHKGIMCGIAAFKNHTKFGFWKASLLAERGFPEAVSEDDGGLGHLRTVDDLPKTDRLVAIVKAAAALNENGVALKREKTAAKPPVKPPAYFLAALKKNRQAMATYDAFNPSNKREYVEWVTEARSDDTRDRRLAQAVEWMAEGKSRNWKYER